MSEDINHVGIHFLVPRDVHGKFKRACALRDEKMKEVLRQLMLDYAADVSLEILATENEQDRIDGAVEVMPATTDYGDF